MTGAVLFAGIGGSWEGDSRAGFRLAYANEWDARAAEAFALNHGLRPDDRDVREVSGRDVLGAAESLTGERLVHLLDTSAPCVAFSAIGRTTRTARERYGSPEAGLVHEQVRVAGEAQPLAVAIENVPQLATDRDMRPHFIRMVRDLEGHGYRVAAEIMPATDFGVPQRRERLHVLAARQDLGIDPEGLFPEPIFGAAATIGDALPHVRRIVRLPRPPHWPEEQTWHSTEQAPTITASGVSAWNYTQVRAEHLDGTLHELTDREVAALMGFPTDWRFPASAGYAKRWHGLGNAVCPPVAEAIAARVRAALLSA